MEKTIEQNNRLIAEFIGFYGNPYTKEPITSIKKDSKYHKSWDWLMPALQKIDKLEYSIPEDSNLIGDITNSLLNLDIEETYLAVVEFIIYNNKNEQS